MNGIPEVQTCEGVPSANRIIGIETKEEREKRMSRERAAKWRSNNKEKHVSYTRQWRAEHRNESRDHSKKNYRSCRRTSCSYVSMEGLEKRKP